MGSGCCLSDLGNVNVAGWGDAQASARWGGGGGARAELTLSHFKDEATLQTQLAGKHLPKHWLNHLLNCFPLGDEALAAHSEMAVHSPAVTSSARQQAAWPIL